MERIRKGDEVIVITGKDKGKRGVVLTLVGASRVMVEGVNVVKKHTRPNPMKNVTGGIADKTMSIDRSNVMLFDPATGKGGRIRIKETDGRRVRVFKANDNVVGQSTASKPVKAAKGKKKAGDK
ncbi:MAG TPA: 50S ribosomal protein L24 [Burkholderiaceae bacterium]|jgi:large subunit ribosomal protein L24|nr:50S ribosomal protein L24 [Burkholderiaceae bacterium]